jgi:gliding motility-associated lipoprotein GldK
MNMKNIILVSFVIALLSACGGYDNGELIGVQNRPMWNPTDPYGMVFIPQGSYTMGPSDQDVPFANVSQSKTVSVGAFYMDVTEITNNEYRQFTTWVRDSILRQYLVEQFPEDYGIAVEDFADGMETGDYKIDWNKKIRWKDEEVRRILEEQMYLPPHERLEGSREFDTREYKYKYQVLDIKSAAVKDNREKGATGERDRSEFLSDVVVKIYPDTLTWNHDYAYSFNEPYTKNYFWHPAFDDYPVVGINWKQANAFANWRTKMMNSFLRKAKQPILPDFRLPTESEWEYASRGGLKSSPYPWGGPYTRNIQGCFLANFKPLRGNYTQDGGLKAIKTASYNPNEYGLYDMAGNVAEWTSNSYDESGLSYSHDMNMDFSKNAQDDDPEVLKRKVIRGGSWKDIAFFIQTSSRTFEYQDTAKSYIGFRCAIDFLGRDKVDFE